MKTGSYLSSARTTSMLVLLLAYVSVDQVTSFLNSAGALQQAREALARAFALQQVSATQVPGVMAMSPVQTRHSCGFFDRVDATQLTVIRTDNRKWRADAFWCNAQERQAPEPKAALVRISRELYLPVADAADPGELFAAIEHHLTDERVEIAPLGFAMRADLTPWVIGPVVVGLLALMRNCTRSVLAGDDHAIEEPWLLVDEGVGAERAVAGLWMTAIALAPWVSGSTIFAAFAWRVYADGSMTTALTDVTLVAIALTVLLSGGWLGMTVASDLIALRAARKERRDAEARRVEAVEAN